MRPFPWKFPNLPEQIEPLWTWEKLLDLLAINENFYDLQRSEQRRHWSERDSYGDKLVLNGEGCLDASLTWNFQNFSFYNFTLSDTQIRYSDRNIRIMINDFHIPSIGGPLARSKNQFLDLSSLSLYRARLSVGVCASSGKAAVWRSIM